MLERLRRRDVDELLISADDNLVGVVPATARETIQLLCTRLELRHGEMPKMIAVTSAVSGEGVTFLGQALAAVLSADLGRTTCLVSANWWHEKPMAQPGLASLLRGEAELDELVRPAHLGGLSLLPAGDVGQAERYALVATGRTAPAFQRLRDSFDNVIIDLPALDVSPVTLRLAHEADGTLLVVRQGKSRIDQVERAAREVEAAGLLGYVLNDQQLRMPAALQRRLLDI